LWPRVTSGRASLFLAVRVSTQAHTLGPRVVGGGMGLHRARQSPRPRDRVRRSSSLEVGPGRARTQGSGVVEPKPKGRARRSRSLEVGRGGAHDLGFGRDKACPQGSGEAKPVTSVSSKVEPPSGVNWSCSRALDCSDVLILMVINSFASGTLVLVPDTS